MLKLDLLNINDGSNPNLILKKGKYLLTSPENEVIWLLAINGKEFIKLIFGTKE